VISTCIEQCWSWLKSRIRKQKNQFDCLRDAIEDVLRLATGAALAVAIIVDNATFHKGGNIIQLIEAAGCQLKYLPSYFPNLNKIERCWSWLKSRIRKQLTQYGCLRDAMEAVLRIEA
jgi:hypothetical protein